MDALIALEVQSLGGPALIRGLCDHLRFLADATVNLDDLARRLARRDSGAEANLQADVQTLLLYGGLNLGEQDLNVELEAPVGGGRRIDVEVGLTVIETKRDLRQGNVREQAEGQLAGYVRDRAHQLGQRYVGVLTDGGDWRLYHLGKDDALHEVSRFELSATTPDVEALAIWLEGALATVEAIQPTPKEIERRLGARSSAHALDYAELYSLYAANADHPTVRLKRDLWARLLRTAFGTSFEDDAAMFVEHTLLVATAEIIAHAVVGLDPATLPPATVLSGQRFAQAGISGVVEEDFFDWVVEVPGGETFVRTLAPRLMRFSWGDVEHDVMKVLYESVIAAEQRHRLGEYYTPDWLAERMVSEVVDAPLEQRVLDPSCGSGTFLFHAVRHYLQAASDHGMAPAEAIVGATARVLGIDVHPLAVTFARVTYLLAIGRDALQAPGRPNFHVPVFLGDSLQWRTPQANLWTKEGLMVAVDDGAQLFDSNLHFPSRLLDDANQFDRLVEELADKAAQSTPGAAPPSLAAPSVRRSKSLLRLPAAIPRPLPAPRAVRHGRMAASAASSSSTAIPGSRSAHRPLADTGLLGGSTSVMPSAPPRTTRRFRPSSGSKTANRPSPAPASTAMRTASTERPQERAGRRPASSSSQPPIPSRRRQRRRDARLRRVRR